MLFPLRLVDPEGPQLGNNRTQIKANSLMISLFACDCENSSETVLVLRGEGIGVPPEQKQ